MNSGQKKGLRRVGLLGALLFARTMRIDLVAFAGGVGRDVVEAD